MKPPPEEKLLKLIRGKVLRPPADAMPATAGAAGAAAMAAPARRALPWPKIAAACLGLILCAEIAWLIAQASWPLPSVPVPTVAPIAGDPPSAAPSPPPPLEMPGLAESATRPLFRSPVPGAATPPKPTSGPSDAAKQLAARLSLMGIVSGDPPQAIIEDAQTKKTFFVTVGQPVVEGAAVEQIGDNRVVLDLSGEKIELSL